MIRTRKYLFLNGGGNFLIKSLKGFGCLNDMTECFYTQRQ